MLFDFTPIWISLKTALAATAVSVVLGIAAAYRMAQYRGRAKGWLDGLLLLPLVLSPSIVGFLLLMLFGKSGPVGWVLARFGTSVVFSWPATVIASTVVAFPLMYKTTAAAFDQVDFNAVQAARTLGASEIEILVRILLPLAWPGVLAGTSLAFARALGEFGATLMLAGNIPGVTQTLPIAVYFAVEGGQMAQAAFWTLFVVAISLVVIAGLHYWSGRGYAVVSRAVRPSDIDLPALDYRAADASVALRGSDSRMGQAPATAGPGEALARDAHLSVDIEKSLADFTLRVAFAIGKEPLGVLGVSGAGKTMTLRCIAGLETPDRGRIVLNGRVLFDSQAGINVPSRERRIGIVFQNYGLFAHLTAAENVAFGLRHLDRQERQRRVRELLEVVQLNSHQHCYPHQLSGGQQQRVAVARALAVNPEAMLLDEPLSGLDTYLRSQMEMQLIEALGSYRGVTLYVTHNLEEAYRISKHLLVISAGRNVAFGPKEAVFSRPPSYVVARVTGCKNLSRARKIASDCVEALDWGCAVQVNQPVPETVAYVGIRAHHLSLSLASEHPVLPNTFRCRLVRANETPFRMTLYLRLDTPLKGGLDHHLEAEIFKGAWSALKDQPSPWLVHLDPQKLFVMND
jgi:molybdate transport system permease protein